MLRDRIIKDLAKVQSTLDSLAQRLNEPAATVEPELKALVIEGAIESSLISDFLKVYRLTEKTRQSLV
jgi:predicted ArsR family transcriptional regulator